MSRHLLIVHPGTLGDVLLAVPAVHALRCAYPSHVIGLLAAKGIGDLLEVAGEVQAVFPIEGGVLPSLFMGAQACRGNLQRWLERCDVAVCWLHDPDRHLASTFYSFGIETTVIRSPHSFGNEPIHQTDRYVAIINDIAACPAAFNGIRLPEAVIKDGRRRLNGLRRRNGPTVMLHPGSGSPHKCTDPRVFDMVIRWCETRDIAPLIVSGPADDEAVEQLSTMVPHVPLVQGLDLIAMAGVLSQASVFIGHDSGLTHLAALLGLPTVALFGPTNPQRWAPRGPHVRVVGGPTCLCQEWTQVRACADKPCLNIAPDRLIAVCEDLLPQMNHPPGQLVLPRELC
ncbi:MAG TPA: glycosyltransferase family 9 protein [Nitrospiraceae bacterium]|jgi:ADP-heptose:LPS heptosyltransferase|nr:glycosyltransferase family 9 protein [Nitrospiraceae bacterium]